MQKKESWLTYRVQFKQVPDGRLLPALLQLTQVEKVSSRLFVLRRRRDFKIECDVKTGHKRKKDDGRACVVASEQLKRKLGAEWGE